MLNKTPQLYYSLDDLRQSFPNLYGRIINEDYPIRLDFFVEDSLPKFASDLYHNHNLPTIQMLTLTYKPFIFITKDRRKEIYYIADGAEHMFLNIGR